MSIVPKEDNSQVFQQVNRLIEENAKFRVALEGVIGQLEKHAQSAETDANRKLERFRQWGEGADWQVEAAIACSRAYQHALHIVRKALPADQSAADKEDGDGE